MQYIGFVYMDVNCSYFSCRFFSGTTLKSKVRLSQQNHKSTVTWQAYTAFTPKALRIIRESRSHGNSMYRRGWLSIAQSEKSKYFNFVIFFSSDADFRKPIIVEMLRLR